MGPGARVVAAQGGTDIWIVPLHVEGSSLRLGATARNLTSRPGYDNQPFFATLARNVGRSLQRIPGTDRVSVLIREPDTPGRIMTWEPGAAGLQSLTMAVPGSRDFAWTPAGTLLMARGRTIFGWTPGREEWETVGTLTAPGTGAATRLAVSPDGAWLAVVLDENGGS